MAANFDASANVGGATLDHAPGVDPVHTLSGERAGISCCWTNSIGLGQAGGAVLSASLR
jgi:hypothetical protein